MREVLCYVTRTGENVGMIAEANRVDWQDIIKWNEGWIAGTFYGKGTYLLEGTRLWLGPPPRKTLDELTEEERAVRLQEEREAAMAAAALDLPGASTMLNDGEVSVLGRSLKGMRQKDLLPVERDEIVNEMFKRVRPLLEKKITDMRQQEEERVKREAKEAERERFLQSERNARNARRADGIPVEAFFEIEEVTTNDRAQVRRGALPPIIAPHGGQLPKEKLQAIRNVLLRGLHLADATPDGDFARQCCSRFVLLAVIPVLKSSRIFERVGLHQSVKTSVSTSALSLSNATV